MARVSVPEVSHFLFHHIQADFGAHPASYLMGSEGSFPRGRAAMG